MKFETGFCKFVEDIVRSVPEYESEGFIILEDVRVRKNIDVHKHFFLSNIKSNTERITNQDETLFTQDDMILVRGFSLKNFWSEFSDSTKKAVWQYIQYLILCAKFETGLEEKGKLIQNENVNITNDPQQGANEDNHNKEGTPNKEIPTSPAEAFEGFENFLKHQMNPDMIKKMAENLKQNKTSINEGNDLMKGLLGTKIGGLAKEIAEDLGVEQLAADLGIKEEDKENPMEVFKKMTSGGGAKKMMGIMSKIGNTLQQKMSSGELNPQDLVQEAMGMMGNISGMKKHPMMKGIQAMFQQQSNKASNNQRLQQVRKSRQQQREQQNQQKQQNQQLSLTPEQEKEHLDKILNFIEQGEQNDNVDNSSKKMKRGKRGGRNKSKK